jgi:alanyl-tRNA synthetase
MTTKKRYEEDVNLREIDSTIVRLDRHLDRPALVLSETIFFPEGGGQPWDLGTINGVALAGVLEADGEVYHLLESDSLSAQFAPGQTVRLILDWERRFDHMQRHCGEHILSGIFFRDYGGINRGFHMGDEYMTIDISLENNPDYKTVTWDMAVLAESEANRIIWQNLPVTTRRYDSKEDAAGIPLRKELAVLEDITIVCVGSPDNPSDCVACCGTHPTTSGQVGLLKIYKVENYKGMFRIYFEAGKRALNDYQSKHQLITALGKKFSAGVDDLLDKVEARETKNSEVRAEFYKLRQSVIQNRLAEITETAEQMEAARMPASMAQAAKIQGAKIPAENTQSDDAATMMTLPKVPMVVRVYDDLPVDDLLTIGRGMSGKFKGLLILHYPTANTLFLFSDGKPDCGKLVKDHLGIYNGKGGGNPTSSRIIFSKPDYPELFIDLLEKHLR